MLKDTTTTTGVTKSIPILVTTTVGTSGTIYNSLGSKTIGTVNLKADIPSFTKTAVAADGTTALTGEQLNSKKIGDEVTFQLKTTVPNTQGYTNYKFKISDTPTAGLVYEVNSQKLNVGNPAVDKTTELTAPTAAVAAGSAINFSIANIADSTKFTYGADLVITYKVKLTAVSSATWQKQNNSAALEYSSDPSDTTGNTTASVDATAVKLALYSVTLNNRKTDGTTKLTGGKFNVKDSGGTILKFAGSAGSYRYDATGTIEDLETDGDGNVVIDGLPSGDTAATYKFNQIASQGGYTSASFDVGIKKNVDGETDANQHTASAKFTNTVDSFGLIGENSITQNSGDKWDGILVVENTNSIAGIPLTGGVGVALVVALAIISGGVVVVASKMRRKNLANARK
ncbi:MAG: isopeptide-forming domain-containing fimbrial protein [Bifidobacterium sp.]|nr:isopeptide-forming domain-containing fimbrial protein [Bifidobacterium sp.]